MSDHAPKDSGGTVAELRAALELATPGPWWAESEFVSRVDDDATIAICHKTGEESLTRFPNARLIACLRNAAPDLLRVVEAMGKTGGVFLDDDAQEYYCNTCGERDCTKESLRHEPDCAWLLARKLMGRAP